MRQIVLDTETTGLEPDRDHRVIEIGCVELVDRRITQRHFHHYLNPEREIDDGALDVHGLTREFLADKPRFADVWDEFLAFVENAELVIHNAAFDIAFLNYEIGRMPGYENDAITRYCRVVDTLDIARRKHPGMRNSLDALCKRYQVDNSQRELHGALLDAEILADVYLLLTGGQTDLALQVGAEDEGLHSRERRVALPETRGKLRVIRADPEEVRVHEERLDFIESESGGGSAWRELAGAGGPL